MGSKNAKPVPIALPATAFLQQEIPEVPQDRHPTSDVDFDAMPEKEFMLFMRKQAKKFDRLDDLEKELKILRAERIVLQRSCGRLRECLLKIMKIGYADKIIEWENQKLSAEKIMEETVNFIENLPNDMKKQLKDASSEKPVNWKVVVVALLGAVAGVIIGGVAGGFIGAGVTISGLAVVSGAAGGAAAGTGIGAFGGYKLGRSLQRD